MGLFFTSYQPLKSTLSSFSDKLDVNTFGSSDAVAGMLAGVISKTGIFPLDVVRKRLQVQGPTRERYVLKDIPVYPTSITGCARAIVKNEGMLGLYSGLWVGLVKSAPASALTMWIFENSVITLRWVEEKYGILEA